MTKSHLHRRRAARRTGYDEGLAVGEAERNNLKGKYQSIVVPLDAAREQIQEIFDHLDDEGDRVYLGSTNHRDWLQDMLNHMDRWSFDAMLPKGDINKMEADPYSQIRAQRARAEAAEAELDSRARALDEAEAEVKRLRTGIKRLSDEEELCAETTGDDPFSLIYLAAKLAAAEKSNADQEQLREKGEAEVKRLRNKVAARALTDAQLIDEVYAVDDVIDAGFGEGGGSPGEWWYERADELEHERKRRELESQLQQHNSRTALSAQMQDVADIPQSPWPASDWAIGRINELEAQTVPEGWKLVPVEPTEEMEKAGRKEAADCDDTYGSSIFSAAEIYCAMLAAAPVKPEGGQ